jgi:hypothetical protein
MFAAGRAASESERTIAATPRVAGVPVWIWPTATAISTAACIMLSLMLVWRDDAPNVAVQPSAPQPTTGHLVREPTIDDFRDIDQLTSRFDSPRRLHTPTRGYLNVRHVALTEGLNAIAHDRATHGNGETSNAAEPPEPATPRDLLEDFLPKHTSTNRLRS